MGEPAPNIPKVVIVVAGGRNVEKNFLTTVKKIN